MPTYIRVKDLPNAATSPASDDFILLSGAANGARRISRADFLSAVAGFYTADPSTYKLATLDAGDKVLVSQLPSSAFSYQGTWAASTNTPTLANGTGTAGDTYYASDSGSVNFGAGSISFLAGDAVVYDGSVWQKVPDVVNLLDGKGTLDEAKTTLEIPDVGTSPQEVPNNGMLGSMAYQSADSVSVDTLEVTDKVDGSLSINNDNKSNYNSNGDDLVVGSGSGSQGISIASGTSDYGVLYFAKGAAPTGGDQYNGYINYNHSNDKLRIGTAATIAVTVDDSQRVGIGSDSPTAQLQVDQPASDQSGAAAIKAVGTAYGTNKAFHGYMNTSSSTKSLLYLENGSGSVLDVKGDGTVALSGAIDFGSTTTGTGTVTGGLLDDYEQGTFTPVFADDATGGNTATVTDAEGVYVKIGRVVNFCILLTNIDTTGLTSGNTARVRGLPFDVGQTSVRWESTVRLDNATFTGYVTATGNTNNDVLSLNASRSGTTDAGLAVSAFTSGSADVFITGTYQVG